MKDRIDNKWFCSKHKNWSNYGVLWVVAFGECKRIMKTFYTIGNLNFKTIELVAKSIAAKFGNEAFDKMVLLNSSESAREQEKQIEIYRKYIHTGFSVLGISVD